LLRIYKKPKKKLRRPSEPERKRELNGCCDLKMESPRKPHFSSAMETQNRCDSEQKLALL